MIHYHTVLQVWKVKKYKTPEYLRQRFEMDPTHKTRGLQVGNVRVPDFKTELASKSFISRGAILWNSLPPHLITTADKLLTYKKKLKAWVKNNVPL